MSATWRTLPAWTRPKTEKPKASLFKTTWARSLAKLEEEVRKSGGTDTVIGIVATPDQLTFAGVPRANMKVLYRGVEVSFEKDGQRLAFQTDVYPWLHDNIHAIALTLEALRAVDRYGATSGQEQYRGFAMLPPGGPDPARGKTLVEAAGGDVRAALRKHHPDHGGREADFVDVQAYREQLGA